MTADRKRIPNVLTATKVHARAVQAPRNLIPAACAAITPEMLPLVQLTAEEIARIVERVPGGATNIKDIYPLAPLQEGILFHHLLGGEGDPYLLATQYSFASRELLDRYLQAMQAVVDRHDILRTAVMWEGFSEPVQVVHRHAPLPVEEIEMDPAVGDVAGQLRARFNPRQYRIDIRQAPMQRIYVVHDRGQAQWLMLLLRHHLTGDHTTLELMQKEIEAHLLGEVDQLAEPLPFRNFVAQTRLGVSAEEHEAYFHNLLGDLEEPTAPYGLLDVRGDGTGIRQAQIAVNASLAGRLRERARKLRVTAATLLHVVWAVVLARVSGRNDVVFGTVLSGRMQAGKGSSRTMGLFINTLPVRIQIGQDEIELVVRRTHEQLADLLRHEHATLALAQQSSGVRAPLPLFSSLLNYRHSGGRKLSHEERQPALEGIDVQYGEERSNYPFMLSVDDFGESFGLTVKVDESIDPNRVCESVHRALESLVHALESAPTTAVRSLDVLPETERQQVVHEWNRTAREYPREQCVHALFEAQVERCPDAAAVAQENRIVSYGELNTWANRLGHSLRDLGVGPDIRVAISMGRTIEMVVAILGVLKAGGAYVPLDPTYPQERLRYMVEDSGAVVVLAEREQAGLFEGIEVPVLEMERNGTARGKGAGNVEREGLRPDHLLYVIYTSGSTGKPKGVQNAHRGVVNRLAWMQQTHRLEAGEGVLQNSSFSFDASVFEILWPLTVGGRVVLAPAASHKDPEGLVEAIRKERVSTVYFVCSMLQYFLEMGGVEGCTSLRRVLCGGERLLATVVERFAERLPEARLWNLYGPSESAVSVTTCVSRSEGEGASVPIGRPVGNVRVYVVGDEGQPVAAGVVGELYIGGAQLARAYGNRPGLTAERFVADGLSGEVGGRLYRTGDVGRWGADGRIEFLGRNDDQVKVRGFRIEPAEIEARLIEHDKVGEAVVVTREDTPGDQRLVAYWVGEDGVDLGLLRAYVAEGLPEYMVPSAYVRLERLPRTPSGKLDRGSLPAPEGAAYTTRRYEAPAGETETALAEIWSELLGVPQVGRQDHFFELGGHSLLAIRMIERMRRRGLRGDVRLVFLKPTLVEFATEIGRHKIAAEVPENRIPKGCKRITPQMLTLIDLTGEEIERIVARVPGGAENVKDIYPLATLQEGLLFHHLLGGDGDPYLNVVQYSFDSRQSVESYLDALRAVIERHDILRTAVMWEGLREPVQVVQRRVELPVEELELNPLEGSVAAQLYDRFNPRRYRISVSQAPLLRICMAYDPVEQRWPLVLLRHHLMGDHETADEMQKEIQAHLLGKADQLPEPLPFRNLVAQARLGVSAEEHEAYFRRLLGDVEEPTAPYGLLKVRGDATAIALGSLRIDALVARRLRDQARKGRVSPASLCHVAWAQVLARVSGRADVVFGTVLFGRMQAGEGSDRVLGVFINTLPVRIRIGQDGAEAVVRRTHEQLAELLRHEHATLALAQRCSGVAAPLPLFSAILNYRYSARTVKQRTEDEERAWQGIRLLHAETRNNYPLTLSVDDTDEGFSLTAMVDRAIDPLQVCESMHRALESLLDALESAPSTPVGSLEVLPERERQQILYEWSQS